MIMKTAMLAVAIFLALAPTGAWAYSYGDANTEEVAETFKLVVSSLGKSPADWKTAEAAHEARRAEIASHFGESVAVTLDQNFKSRKAADVIANYKAVLVMNLDRRFDNAVQSIDDYTKAKLLLAKAKATFDTLEPYADAKLSASAISAIKADFDVALEAIGNPGLFGVGKKESDPDALKKAVNRIYGKLKPLFPYTAYKAPAKPAAQSGTGTGAQAGAAKPSAPAAQTGTKTGTAAAPRPSAANTTTKEQAAETGKEAAKPDEVASNTQAEAETKPDETAAEQAEPDKAAEPAQAEPAAQEPAKAEPSTQAAADGSDATSASSGETQTADNGAAQAAAETIDGTSKHAPMAQTDKTNSAVTVGVIGGVAVIGAGAVWWARRKGFF
jgi:hypothetical protein